MKFRWNVAAAAILAAGLVVSVTNASGQTPQPTKHTATRRAAEPKGPSVEDQINALRQEMQSQIDSLKSDLSTKDDQLKQAQQQAADAQAAAAKAQAAADAQQQAFTENADGCVNLAKFGERPEGESSFAGRLQFRLRPRASRRQITNPDAIYFKGVDALIYGQLPGGRNRVAPGRHGRRHQHAVYRRAAGQLPGSAVERVLCLGPSVAPGVQSDRQDAQPLP